MELTLLIGLQGSGKSSFYRARLEATHALVSKDLWPNARNREARQRAIIDATLAAGRPIAVDNTNPTHEDRAPLIAIARTHGARVVGYVFESDLSVCLPRNAGRIGRARVPDVALYATRKRMVWPALDEGFDRLYFVRIVPDAGFEITDWRGEP